jgi:ribosomal protein S30
VALYFSIPLPKNSAYHTLENKTKISLVLFLRATSRNLVHKDNKKFQFFVNFFYTKMMMIIQTPKIPDKNIRMNKTPHTDEICKLNEKISHFSVQNTHPELENQPMRRIIFYWAQNRYFTHTPYYYISSFSRAMCATAVWYFKKMLVFYNSSYTI